MASDTGKTLVTYPIPGAPGAVATATLDARYMAERVEVRQGNVVTVFTYADYQDWNNPLNKIEAFYAGKLVETRNGAPVRDLTTVETETGNVYVVMPVPASVQYSVGGNVAAMIRPFCSVSTSSREDWCAPCTQRLIVSEPAPHANRVSIPRGSVISMSRPLASRLYSQALS